MSHTFLLSSAIVGMRNQEMGPINDRPQNLGFFANLCQGFEGFSTAFWSQNPAFCSAPQAEKPIHQTWRSYLTLEDGYSGVSLWGFERGRCAPSGCEFNCPRETFTCLAACPKSTAATKDGQIRPFHFVVFTILGPICCLPGSVCGFLFFLSPRKNLVSILMCLSPDISASHLVSNSQGST